MSHFLKSFLKTVLFTAVVFTAAVMADGDKAEAKVFPQSHLERTVNGIERIKKHYKDDSTDAGRIETAADDAVTEKYSDEDLRYLSAIIFCEANDMSEEAMIAVGNVIENRKNNDTDWSHVNTIKEVIYDNKWGVQFSPTTSGSLDAKLEIYDNLESYKGNWKYDTMLKCIAAAKAVFDGEKSIPDSYLYFNGNISASKEKCKKNNKSYKIIDGHIYF